MAETRINARLDDESASDLEFIKLETEASTLTEALKFSLHEVAGRLRRSHRRGAKMKAFLDSDYIGCAEGPEDLSENYKAYLYQGWKNKHGIE